MQQSDVTIANIEMALRENFPGIDLTVRELYFGELGTPYLDLALHKPPLHPIGDISVIARSLGITSITSIE